MIINRTNQTASPKPHTAQVHETRSLRTPEASPPAPAPSSPTVKIISEIYRRPFDSRRAPRNKTRRFHKKTLMAHHQTQIQDIRHKIQLSGTQPREPDIGYSITIRQIVQICYTEVIADQC